MFYRFPNRRITAFPRVLGPKEGRRRINPFLKGQTTGKMFCETDLEESLSKEITPFISAVVTIIYFSFAKKEEPYSFPLDDV